MATRFCAFSKKWYLLARDTLGLNRAKPVAKARLRQIDSPNSPLSDFYSLQYANNVRHTLIVNPLQTLHYPRTNVLIPKPVVH